MLAAETTRQVAVSGSIEFLDVRYLKGPNIWTYRPVLEAWVDIGALEDFPSDTIPGLYERLSSMLPGLVEHRCSYGERGGFLRRLKEGTWPGHILEHVALELQGLAGMPGGFGKARETSRRGVYKVVVRAFNEALTRACLDSARDLVMAAIYDHPYDVDAARRRLRRMADSLCLGPSTACIVDAADDRDIPATRLNDGNLVQLGYGARQRRIWTAETDATPAIAESISRDKVLTKGLLGDCGVPVPEGRLVGTLEEAWEAAEEIGLPVVVKPSDGNHGRGVFIDLETREQVEAAFEVAREEGSGVIVERFVPGIEHRLLIVGGRLAAAARGEETFVTGNGRDSIAELIDIQINSNPLRGSSEEHPLNLVRLDSSARLELQRQGLKPDSVPAQGIRVLVQRNGSVAFDVTDKVHPETAEIAALAARIVGLDIAGVDLLATDISRPLAEQNGAIVEVNAGPGLLMHLKPAEGEPQPVGRAIVDSLFPEGEFGRIPVVGIAGTGDNGLLARLVAWLLQLDGRRVGMACSEGLFQGRRWVKRGNRTDWSSMRKVLLNPGVDAAVFENGPRTLLGEGLAYDRCQVGVVTEISPELRMEEFDILNADQMAGALRTQVDVVLPTGVAVLNAADARVADMAKFCDGEVIYYSPSPEAPPLVAHLSAGGRAVTLREGKAVLARGGAEIALIDAASLPGGEHAMLAGIAAAWALNLAPELIRAGVESFDTAGA